MSMEDEALVKLVARLKARGYLPVHWYKKVKGLRATLTGKIAIPADESIQNICLNHGNLVRVIAETHRGYRTKGVRILEVVPCVFCRPISDFDNYVIEESMEDIRPWGARK